MMVMDSLPLSIFFVASERWNLGLHSFIHGFLISSVKIFPFFLFLSFL